VREQVADGRAHRAGRLVQVDDAFLGGNENGQRRHRLGHGGEPHGSRRVAAHRDVPGGIDDTGRRKLDGPAVDLAECVHARRY
jgi:hypothetical protein